MSLMPNIVLTRLLHHLLAKCRYEKRHGSIKGWKRMFGKSSFNASGHCFYCHCDRLHCSRFVHSCTAFSTATATAAHLHQCLLQQSHLFLICSIVVCCSLSALVFGTHYRSRMPNTATTTTTAQRSMDHRGTPAFPGLVATLVADDHLQAMGLKDTSEPQSETFGAVYRIPDEDAEQVLADLDHR
jgi:ChaC-like protein